MTNGPAKGGMHVVIQPLVEVAVGIEAPPKNQALSMLGPELNVAGQSDITTLARLTHLTRERLKARMLGVTGEAVDDVIALARWLD